MLSVATVNSASAAGGYYQKDNYYTAEDATLASQWAGEGAAAQGLAGEVGIEAFKAVLEGKLPDGTVLASGEGRERRAGMDLTFSAPKSLSMLAYIGGDKRLLEANAAAAKATIAWAEKNLAQTRIEKDGKSQIVNTGNLLVALFQHDTSRELDPQAHVHAVIANATKGPDGKWRALHNDQLWKQNTVLGSIYHAELRTRVEELGYRTEPVGKHGSFEITGVSKEAREVFSTRRKQILDAYNELDHQNPRTGDAVTLKTRRAKAVIEDRGALLEAWRDRAAEAGIDLAPVVDAALAWSARAETRWSRVTKGVSSAADGARAVVAHVGAIVGLRERDPLVPKQPWRMRPGELAAAHAVASAVRHLSEREAAFSRFAIYKAALDFGLPITVDQVERRVAQLERNGHLLGGKDGSDKLVTTESALRLERAIVDGAERGRGRGSALMSADVAGAQLQDKAIELKGFKLNAGQETAGRLLLASRDRVVAVEGSAGAGKSTMIAPAAAILAERGVRAIGLGFQNKMVVDLGASTGLETRTIASFLARHRRILDGTAGPAALGRAQGEWRGAFVLVDEKSMVDNDQAAKLIALGEKLGLGRLAFIGGNRQLGAIAAGKPAEMLERSGIATAQMPENVRARGEAVKAFARAFEEGRVGDAMAALSAYTIEAKDRLAATAAELWLALPAGERERTALYASGRAHAGEINRLVQEGRVARGELGAEALRLTVLDPLSRTREEMRYASSYEAGQVLELRRVEQGVMPGLADVTAVDHARGVVTLRDRDGREHKIKPSHIDHRRKEDALRLHREKEIELREQDRIRWRDNDKERGLFNADTAHVTKVGPDGITVITSVGIELKLRREDPMLRRLDLAYALNAHMAQGTTSDLGIAVLDSRERNLATERLALVTATRVRDGLTLVTDDARRLETRLASQSGDKTSALEVTGEVGIGHREVPKVTPQAVADRAREKAVTPPRQPAREPELDRKIGDGGRSKQLELGL